MAGPRSPELSVVICSLNGSAGVVRCLRSLHRQQSAAVLDVVVVDDGSTDDTACRAGEHGARVLRHAANRGVAAARNTGLRSARAPIVAFLDDDCEVAPTWADCLLESFREAPVTVVAIGSAVTPEAPDGYMRGYLRRNNPLAPLELDLARASGAPYRLARYLVRSWSEPPAGRRYVFALASASLSARADALAEVGGFDDIMRFGPEDLDICMRLRERFGERSLWLDPRIAVTHHFQAQLTDSVRRSHAYGRGHVQLLRKYPTVRPTVFPLPLVLVGLLLVGMRHRRALLLALALPQMVHARGLHRTLRGEPAAVLDAYVTVLLEAGYLVGAFTPGSGAVRALAVRRWRTGESQNRH